jgi:hypothetical protein
MPGFLTALGLEKGTAMVPKKDPQRNQGEI